MRKGNNGGVAVFLILAGAAAIALSIIAPPEPGTTAFTIVKWAIRASLAAAIPIGIAGIWTDERQWLGGGAAVLALVLLIFFGF